MADSDEEKRSSGIWNVTKKLHQYWNSNFEVLFNHFQTKVEPTINFILSLPLKQTASSSNTCVTRLARKHLLFIKINDPVSPNSDLWPTIYWNSKSQSLDSLGSSGISYIPRSILHLKWRMEIENGGKPTQPHVVLVYVIVVAGMCCVTVCKHFT